MTDPLPHGGDYIINLLTRLRDTESNEVLDCLTNDLNTHVHNSAMLARRPRLDRDDMIDILDRWTITLRSIRRSAPGPQTFAPKRENHMDKVMTGLEAELASRPNSGNLVSRLAATR